MCLLYILKSYLRLEWKHQRYCTLQAITHGVRANIGNVNIVPMRVQYTVAFNLVSPAYGWKAISSVMPQFRNQAKIEIGKDGVTLKLLDISRNEFVSLFWGKDKFDLFEIDNEEEVASVVFYTDDLYKVFKRFDADDRVNLTSPAADSLLIKHDNTDTSFNVRLLDKSTDDAGFVDPPPNQLNSQEFMIDMQVFEKMIADCEVFSAEAAWLDNVDGKLIFTGKSGFGETKGLLIQNFDEEMSNTGFAFEFIRPFLSSVKPFIDSTIKARLTKGKPMMLEIELKNVGTMKYFVSPRRVD